MMKTVRLKGLTGHGKNRVREHGELWEVLELPTGVIKMSHKPPFPPLNHSRLAKSAG